MPVRIGFLGVAHMHAYGYAAALAKHPDVDLVGVWDCNGDRLAKFTGDTGLRRAASADALLESCDAVVITSTNKSHVEDVEMAAAAGRAVLCEKPVVTSAEEAERMRAAVKSSGITFMTAFPCRFSPAYTRLRERVRAGDIGNIKAICATNRGRCPFDWFVDPSESGGGAMIDHTVHVADLMRDLLGESPSSVVAQTGNNMYGQEWEDTAMLTLEFSSGVFASLDSSWSRPQGYKTWGDVTMNVVGEKGVIELDMFAQEVQVYGKAHTVAGYGSDLDDLLVAEFVSCLRDHRAPITTLEDGIEAAMIAVAGYKSRELIAGV